MIFVTTSLCEYMCIKTFSVLINFYPGTSESLHLMDTNTLEWELDLFYFPSIYLIVVASVSDMPAFFFVFQQCAFNFFLFTL